MRPPFYTKGLGLLVRMLNYNLFRNRLFCCQKYASIEGSNDKEDKSMANLPNCPQCNGEYTYEDGVNYVCPMCGHEWSQTAEEHAEEGLVVRDANGNLLQDGDTVTVIKDLKVKGSSQALKQGTKVKGIRLVEGDHNIDCKIDGFGGMKLKSEFVKKI